MYVQSSLGPYFPLLCWGQGEGVKNIEVKMTNYTIHICHLLDPDFKQVAEKIVFVSVTSFNVKCNRSCNVNGTIKVQLLFFVNE